MKKLFLSSLVILTVHISFAQLTKEIFYKSLFGKEPMIFSILSAGLGIDSCAENPPLLFGNKDGIDVSYF